MDLSSAALVLAGITALKEPAQDFLKRASGPAADEIGEWMRDKIHVFRMANAVSAVSKAQEKLALKGREPQEVPLRTLLPLLEGASLEDDPFLSDKWAALLASAADASHQRRVLPSFPHILENLSPTDARMLELMYANEWIGGTVRASDGVDIDRGWTLKEEILVQLEMAVEQFELSYANLFGLGLVEVGARAFGSTRMIVLDKREVGLTALGTAFVAACLHDDRVQQAASES
jgi:hypothetical protein